MKTELLYEFTLNYISDFMVLGRSESQSGEFKIITNNSPEKYLEESIRLDIDQGWDGKGKLPIRKWWITDLSLADNQQYEEDEISNFDLI